MKDLKKKCKKWGMLLLLLICGGFAVTNCKVTTVQAASSTTMKKAYQNYVKKNKRNIKGYAYANIGPSRKPALLVVTRSDWKQGNLYYSCKVYYYIQGKVRFMNSYGGGRPLTLYKRNGNYYLWNGTSSDKSFACIKNDRFYVIENCDSKEVYYKTRISYRKTGRTTYKIYMLSKRNYKIMNGKYKYYKTVNFRKIN